MKCFYHKFIELKGILICEKCGLLWEESQKKVKRNILGQIKKSVIIRKENLDEILKDK
jgi:hypothetical protein